MKRPKTKIYKFPVGTSVVVSNSMSEHYNTAGKIYDIEDPTDQPYDWRRDRAPTTQEVKYSVIIKNKQSKAAFLAEDPDNEAEDYEEYDVIGFFFAADLRRGDL